MNYIIIISIIQNLFEYSYVVMFFILPATYINRFTAELFFFPEYATVMG